MHTGRERGEDSNRLRPYQQLQSLPNEFAVPPQCLLTIAAHPISRSAKDGVCVPFYKDLGGGGEVKCKDDTVSTTVTWETERRLIQYSIIQSLHSQIVRKYANCKVAFLPRSPMKNRNGTAEIFSVAWRP